MGPLPAGCALLPAAATALFAGPAAETQPSNPACGCCRIHMAQVSLGVFLPADSAPRLNFSTGRQAWQPLGFSTWAAAGAGSHFSMASQVTADVFKLKCFFPFHFDELAADSWRMNQR